MQILMLISAIIAIVSAVIVIVMINVKKEPFTNNKVKIPAIIFFVFMVLSIVFYLLI